MPVMLVSMKSCGRWLTTLRLMQSGGVENGLHAGHLVAGNAQHANQRLTEVAGAICNKRPQAWVVNSRRCVLSSSSGYVVSGSASPVDSGAGSAGASWGGAGTWALALAWASAAAFILALVSSSGSTMTLTVVVTSR